MLKVKDKKDYTIGRWFFHSFIYSLEFRNKILPELSETGMMNMQNLAVNWKKLSFGFAL